MSPAAKHIDCFIPDHVGHSAYEKVWFIDEKIVGASGNEYNLGSFLTKGNNGTLFRCYSSKNEELAVKFLHRLDPQRSARFEFETQVLIDLDHDGILPCIDAGEVATTARTPVPFIVTDLYDENLQGRVDRQGPLSVESITLLFVQMCEAFVFLHGKGLIHRDIKPSNFFLRRDRVIVGDFGLAKTTTDEGVDRYYRHDITLAGDFVGPILWMSPELIAYQKDKRVEVDQRSDLFQLGLILWFMLTGEIPRGGLDEDDDPSGGHFWEIVTKATKQKPERRFDSVSSMLESVNSMVNSTQ